MEPIIKPFLITIILLVLFLIGFTRVIKNNINSILVVYHERFREIVNYYSTVLYIILILLIIIYLKFI